MVAVQPVRPKRGPGRPPDVNGDNTKAEIHRAARRLFAIHGYVNTTTRMISLEVGVTPAALHHHFGAKRNIALAVWWATTEAAFLDLHAAVGAEDTFVGKFQAMLRASGDFIRRDREASSFVSTMREEARHTPELIDIVDDQRLPVLVREVVDHGVRTGVVASADAAQVQDTMSALVLGATLLATDLDTRSMAQLFHGCTRLCEGSLYSAPRRTTRNRAASG